MAGRVARLAYPHRRETLALAEELREARSGGYWIAVGADAGVRRAVLALLRRELEGTDVLAVRLSADEPGPWRTLGAKALRAKKAASLVMVVELPVVATGEDEAPGRHPVELLRRLNVGREIAPGRGWRVVLWTTLGRVPDLTEWMPDIWAYRRSVAWMPGSADFIEAARNEPLSIGVITRARARLREADSRRKWASGLARLAALRDAANAAIDLGASLRADIYLKQAEELIRGQTTVDSALLASILASILVNHQRRWTNGFHGVIESYAADPVWRGDVATAPILTSHRSQDAAMRGRYSEAIRHLDSLRALMPLSSAEVFAVCRVVAGACIDRGRLRAARVLGLLAQAEVERHESNFAPDAITSIVAIRGRIAWAAGDAFEALVDLHRAADCLGSMKLNSARSGVEREAARLYRLIGLRQEALSMRARTKDAPPIVDTRSIPDDELLPLDRMNRFLDRAEHAFAHHDLPAAGAALSVARDAWAAEDADFRSLYGLGRIRRLEARLLVTRGDVSSALRTLQGALASVEAEGLIHERFRLLVAIAALPPAADIDLTRYDAARDALSIADRTRYVEEEIEALLRLSAAARSLGRREEARTHADRAAEIRRQVGRRPPRALEHRP